MDNKNENVKSNSKLLETIKKKKILFIIVLFIIIAIGTFFILRNKMTAEETVSKFMYLVENKEYEKAKKLANEELEHLDLLANVKPSNLTFKFSKDKKEAVSVLLEEEISQTKLNVELDKTIMGWKIKDFNVSTELIEPQEIEDRLKSGEEVSDIQLLYWGESDVSSKDEIAEYVKDNGTVAVIFAEIMKAQEYDKANELYQVLSKDKESLTIEQLKKYNWDNYEIQSNLQVIENMNSIIIKLDNKTVGMMITGKKILMITKVQ